MIHSRPGYAPRTSDEAPAKLNDDMIPAINRGAKEDKTPLKSGLQSKADYAYDKLRKARDTAALAEAQAIAAKVGPDILVNPSPVQPPKILEPGK